MKKLFLILPLIIVLSSGKVQQGETDISKAEAMFIYNFSRLIQWPEAYQTGNFVIGVLGSNSVFSELATYTTGKKVGFQNIEIKKFKTPEEIVKCHILFVAYSKSASITSISEKVSNFSTLIIAEKPGSVQEGAAINFMVNDVKLQFELSESNATKYNLKISSRLKDMASKNY